MSECWKFYAVPTARVISMVKISLEVFSLRREHVWTVLGDLRDEEGDRVRTAGDQTLRSFLLYFDPW